MWFKVYLVRGGGGTGGGTGGLMVKTRALDLESQGSSPASVRAFFSFPLFNLNALEFTQLYPIK